MEQWKEDVLVHYGILGMKWGIRRFQPYSVKPRKSGKGGKEIGKASGKPEESLVTYSKTYHKKTKLDGLTNDEIEKYKKLGYEFKNGVSNKIYNKGQPELKDDSKEAKEEFRLLKAKSTELKNRRSQAYKDLKNSLNEVNDKKIIKEAADVLRKNNDGSKKTVKELFDSASDEIQWNILEEHCQKTPSGKRVLSFRNDCEKWYDKYLPEAVDRVVKSKGGDISIDEGIKYSQVVRSTLSEAHYKDLLSDSSLFIDDDFLFEPAYEKKVHDLARKAVAEYRKGS